MISIIEYSDRYDDAIMLIDLVAFYTVKYHADVIKGSVCLAVDDDKLIGVGFLKAGATFLKVTEYNLPYYFIEADFLTDENADVAKQVMASDMLIEELKKRFESIQEQYPDKRLILRLWHNSEKTAYQEYLMGHGFRPMRLTQIMIRTLDDIEITDLSETIVLDNGETLEIMEMDPYDEVFAEEYTLTTRDAFEVEDSINELRFTMGGEDSHVFAVMKGKRVIAALTTWLVMSGRSATENIFCASDYRRKGITTVLINYVLSFLKKNGYDKASLTVFGDNQPAFQLYSKLGYELTGNMIELHYEKEYKNVGF